MTATPAPTPTTLTELWPDGGARLVEPPAGTDAWKLHDAGAWVVITTNKQRRRNGAAVMGGGLALAAARRYPDLPTRYGNALAAGNARIAVNDYRLLLAPTKDDWRDPSPMSLVIELLDAVARWADTNPAAAIVVPSPGCGLGGLAWPPVRDAAIERLRDRRVALLAPL